MNDRTSNSLASDTLKTGRRMNMRRQTHVHVNTHSHNHRCTDSRPDRSSRCSVGVARRGRTGHREPL